MLSCKLCVVAFVIALALAVSACASSAYKQTETLRRPEGLVRIVIMPMDVQVSELTIGGMSEAKADWTQQAEQNIQHAIQKKLQNLNADYVAYVGGMGNTDYVGDEGGVVDAHLAQQEQQVLKLHEAVGQTILAFRLNKLSLLNKRGVFDWSLGPDVRVLAEQYAADYALFVFVRDSYASDGRIATEVAKTAAMAILSFGSVVYVPQGGQQTGFASLIDLKTGNVAWFNFVSRGAGDFRNPRDAESSVDVLLTDLPT